MNRSLDGKLLVWMDVVFDGRNVFGKRKQGNIGASGVQLTVGKVDAKTAMIPPCILKEKGPHAGIFERKVFAFNAAGQEVELATFSEAADGTTVVTPCSDAALASIVRLGLKLKGKGAETAEKVAALKRFSITLASAPAADEEDEGAGEGEEGADDEGEGDEDDA